MTDLEAIARGLSKARRVFRDPEHQAVYDKLREIRPDVLPDRIRTGEFDFHESVKCFIDLAQSVATPPTTDASERMREAVRDFRWRANQCRTNLDAFDSNAAAIWDLAADALEAKS